MKPDTRPAIRSMKDATTVERIAAWLEGGDKPNVLLSAWEQTKYLRMKMVYIQLVKGRDPLFIAQHLVKIHGISLPTAYADIKDAKQLWPDVHSSSRQADRVIVLARIRRGIALAWKKQDLKAYEKLCALEVKVLGLDRDEPMMPDFSAVESSVFIIGNFPETLNMPKIYDPETAAREFLSKKLKADDAEIVEEPDGE